MLEGKTALNSFLLNNLFLIWLKKHIFSVHTVLIIDFISFSLLKNFEFTINHILIQRNEYGYFLYFYHADSFFQIKYRLKIELLRYNCFITKNKFWDLLTIVCLISYSVSHLLILLIYYSERNNNQSPCFLFIRFICRNK